MLLSLQLTLQDPFPISAICGSVWKNTEGQLSFLKNAVFVPPEVFSFAHSGRQLVRSFYYLVSLLLVSVHFREELKKFRLFV